MKKSISYQARIAGVHELITFYWNGSEFTETKCSLKGNIEEHKANALEYMKEHAPIAFAFLADYNFAIA